MDFVADQRVNGARLSAPTVLDVYATEYLADESLGLREQGLDRLVAPRQSDRQAHVESFNGRLHEGCLNSNWFVWRQEAKRATDAWRLRRKNNGVT